MSTPSAEQVQKQNLSWWTIHAVDYPHHVKTSLETTGDHFPPRFLAYGRYIYCPMPAAEQTLWGFVHAEGAEAFKADLAAGKLPVRKQQGGADILTLLAIKDEDPFAALGVEEPAPKAAPPVKEQKSGKPASTKPSVEDDPFAGLMDEEPAKKVDDDPFADLEEDDPFAGIF